MSLILGLGIIIGRSHYTDSVSRKELIDRYSVAVLSLRIYHEDHGVVPKSIEHAFDYNEITEIRDEFNFKYNPLAYGNDSAIMLYQILGPNEKNQYTLQFTDGNFLIDYMDLDAYLFISKIPLRNE